MVTLKEAKDLVKNLVDKGKDITIEHTGLDKMDRIVQLLTIGDLTSCKDYTEMKYETFLNNRIILDEKDSEELHSFIFKIKYKQTKRLVNETLSSNPFI